MFKNILRIGLIILVLSPQFFTAQDRDDDWDRDSHKRRSYNWKWDWDWNDQDRPTIELNYGIGKLKHKNFGADYSDVGLAEIKLGFSSLDEYYYDYIYEYSEHFFFASNISTDLKQKNNDSLLLDSDLWRFGLGWRDGYGYNTGPVAFIPYTQFSLTWSKLKMQEYPDSTFAADITVLDKYNDSFRFGTSAEAGLMLEFDSFVGINASYETNVIFPRHLFWKHAGSVALEAIGLSTIDYFVDEIIDSSPAAGPILNFLLKSGFMYGFYHLQKDKMNWPFDTEAPLTYETFKFGASFIF